MGPKERVHIEDPETAQDTFCGEDSMLVGVVPLKIYELDQDKTTGFYCADCVATIEEES